MAAIVFITSPANIKIAPTPSNSGGAYDKKIEIDQAKKNYILRRFISYCDVKNFRD